MGYDDGLFMRASLVRFSCADALPYSAISAEASRERWRADELHADEADAATMAHARIFPAGRRQRFKGHAGGGRMGTA